MARSRPWSSANPDLRRRTQVPAPAIGEIEQSLLSRLSPGSFKPLTGLKGTHGKGMRERVLTLPVMMAVVLSLVYRQISGLSELLRVLHQERLLWVEPMRVSVEAVSKRLRVLPVSLFSELFESMLPQLQGLTRPVSEQWQPLRDCFSAIWIADGSTLEELRRQLKVLRDEPKTVLAGKMMAVVELLTHRPLKFSYDLNPKANDKTFDQWLLQQLPPGGLLVFDLGFFKFPWFDQFTEQGKYFLTRLREKTAYQVVQALSTGPRYRDELVQLGTYRSNPCRHRVRLVSVLWDSTWYCYLTNVLDPKQLPPHLVCELYRRRWRIEDAFALTKRLLGLAYLWVGDTNGVQIQIYATWIFYAILNELCAQVAIALNQPLERISVEMVFRGLYHYAQALLRGSQQTVVPFLVEHHRLLALVKSVRKRQRKRDVQFQEIWGFPALS
jgi:hypothetical protein